LSLLLHLAPCARHEEPLLDLLFAVGDEHKGDRMRAIARQARRLKEGG
jgi:hypothetical protein